MWWAVISSTSSGESDSADMTVRRLAAVDAQTYWMSAKIPNDAFLLYGFAGVPGDLEQAIGSVSSIIDAESVRHERLRDLESQVGRLVVEMEKQLDRYPQA